MQHKQQINAPIPMIIGGENGNSISDALSPDNAAYDSVADGEGNVLIVGDKFDDAKRY